MSDPIISVENLGKKYLIDHQAQGQRYTALRDIIAENAKKLIPFRRSSQESNGNPRTEEFWALKDVSFEIHQGEVVGIIGRNGAGKSTLLKILSRITEPTAGRVRLRGRVASLLEVGTGFHPELTGRENTYLNGAILGMTRAEIRRKFDEIVAFAEVEKFLDTPVKRYSSGMYVRLAFAVAAHLEPEILVVDEVLAVGDAEFQKKCLGKMGEVARKGRTVLFVSHNLTAVATLCQKALWLNRGQAVMYAPTTNVISQYLRPESGTTGFDPALFPDDPNFRLLNAVLDQEGNSVGPFITSAPLDVVLEYEIKEPAPGLRVGVDIMTADGITLWRSFDDDMLPPAANTRAKGRYRAVCRLPANVFFPRDYVVCLSIAIHGIRWISFGQVSQIIDFCNIGGVGAAYADENHRPFLLLPALDWETTLLKNEKIHNHVLTRLR